MLPEFPLNSTNQLVQAAKGCTYVGDPAAPEANEHIQRLLQAFNLGVQASFAAGGVQALQPLTTADGYVRMQKKYAGWISRGVVELNLVSCEFLAFNLTGDNQARAYTFEKWVFVYADGKSVPTAGSVDGYVLEYADGGWRVKSVMTYAPEEN
jgi:hypothetical protein